MSESRTGRPLELIAWLTTQPDRVFKVEEYHEKRSLNANGYFFALVEKIAKERAKDDPKVTKEEVHRQMILDYGTWDKNEDGSVKWVIFPKNKPLPSNGYYWDTKTEVTVHGQNSGVEVGEVYIVVRGSHTYNAKEMSELIKGTIQEAQNLGIETRTPAEIEEMLRDMK